MRKDFPSSKLGIQIFFLWARSCRWTKWSILELRHSSLGQEKLPSILLLQTGANEDNHEAHASHYGTFFPLPVLGMQYVSLLSAAEYCLALETFTHSENHLVQFSLVSKKEPLPFTWSWLVQSYIPPIIGSKVLWWIFRWRTGKGWSDITESWQ